MATSEEPSLPAAAQATAGQGEVVLAVDGLAKAFGRTQALRECTFSARACLATLDSASASTASSSGRTSSVTALSTGPMHARPR